MAETKSRILYILKYLLQNTDAEHYATTGDIFTYLKGKRYLLQTEKPYRETLRSSVILVLILKKKEAVRTAIP